MICAILVNTETYTQVHRQKALVTRTVCGMCR